MELSYSVQWLLFSLIVLSNLLFLLFWLYFLFGSAYSTLLFKYPRVFSCLCLCGRSRLLKEKRL